MVLSHMADRSVFGTSARGPHLVNVLLHATATVLVLLLAYAWMPHRGFALFAGLLFAVHPVHVEAVAWVSGRSDLLFGVFFSLALLSDKLYGSSARRRWLAASLAFFVAALSSKEAAVVLPVLVAVRAFLTDVGEGDRSRWHRTLTAPLPSLVTLAVFLWIRFGLIATPLPTVVSVSAQRATVFWTWWSAFLRYMELLVVPVKLTILHELKLADSWWLPRVLAGLLVFGLLTAGAWRLRATPAAAFGVATLLICLAPLSNFVFPISTQSGAEFPLAERFLYVPSIGFCLALAWLFSSWLPARLESTTGGRARDDGAPSRWRPPRVKASAGRLSALAFLVVILVAGTRAHGRVRDWASDLTLFATAVQDSPGSYLGHLNYASALASEARQEAQPEAARNMHDAAIRHYLAALEIAPENYRVHYDLGNLYQFLGLEDEAEAAYRQALLLHPGLPQARINLGALLAQTGDLTGALAQFTNAEHLLPGVAAPIVNKGHVLQMLGRHEEAIPAYQKALALEPGLVAALEGLARAREAVGTID